MQRYIVTSLRGDDAAGTGAHAPVGARDARFLALAGIDATLQFSARPLARIAEWVYHAGMALSVGAMLVFGTMQVLGIGFVESARSGIAGLGHVLLTVAFGLLFAALLRRRTVTTEVA